MGYSIAVTPTTPRRGMQALEFGLKHFRSIRQIEANSFGELPEMRFVMGDLSYDHHPRHLGFDYSAGSDRELIWSLTRWLAQRVGRRLNGQANFLYDGIERMFIDREKVDPDGWHTTDYLASLGIWRRRELRAEGKLIRPELARLSKLWSKENR